MPSKRDQESTDLLRDINTRYTWPELEMEALGDKG